MSRMRAYDEAQEAERARQRALADAMVAAMRETTTNGHADADEQD